MKMTKPGNPLGGRVFAGTCPQCKAEFEANQSELSVESCPREHYDFARTKCTCCGYTNLILYPKG